MSLIRSEAEERGLRFSTEDDRPLSSPDIGHFAADATRDGHTFTFEATSEAGVLDRFDAFLRNRGEIEREREVAPGAPTDETQSVDELRAEGDES